MDLTLAEARMLDGDMAAVYAEQAVLRAKLDTHAANEKRLQAKVKAAEQEKARMTEQLAERLKKNAVEDAAELAAVEGASRFRVAGGRDIDLDLETSDPLGTNEFTLQCMSFTPAEDCEAKALFFVVQFYHFPPTRTECVRLVQTTAARSRVLVREGPTGSPLMDQPPGLTVRYTVSGDGDGGLSTRKLPSYLATACLHIEVWDAESLIQMGTVRMPLGTLLRQGTERVETLSTLDVCSERANSSEVYGKLQLRMVCAGHITPMELEADAGRGKGGADRVQSVLPAPASIVRQKHVSRPKTVHESESTMDAFSSTVKVEDDTVRSWRLRSAKGMVLDEDGALSPRPSSSRSPLVDGRSAAMVQLDAIRAHSRTAKIKLSLHQAITRCVRLSPTFGRAEYFELVFENPFPDDHTFTLNCPHEEISVVTDEKERQAFGRASYDLASSAKQLNPTSMAADLKPAERVHIVFKFFSCCCGHPMSLSPEQRGAAKDAERSFCEGTLDYTRPMGTLPDSVGGAASLHPEHGLGHVWHHSDPIAARTMEITLDAAETGQVGARLEVEIMPNSAVVDSRMHLYRPQNEWFRSTVKIQPYMIPRGKGGAGRPRGGAWSALCTRGDVVASVAARGANKPGEQLELDLELRGRSGSSPRVETFFVLLYQDGYDATPRGLWQVVLHSLEDRPILTTAGQAAETKLAVRLLNDTQVVLYRSSAPSLEVTPSSETKIGLGGLVEAGARLRPGMEIGRHSWIVTCVEAEQRLSQREVLWSWLVSTTVQPPLISRRYEAYGLPHDREKRVKISFENKHATSRAFALHTNQPAVLHLPQQRLVLSAGASAFIEVIFQPQPEGTLVDTTVFLNDEDERTDTCIAIRGCWMPPPSAHDSAGNVITNPQAESDAAAAVDKAREAAEGSASPDVAAVDEPEGTTAEAAAAETAAAETAAAETAAEAPTELVVDAAAAEPAAPADAAAAVEEPVADVAAPEAAE